MQPEHFIIMADKVLLLMVFMQILSAGKIFTKDDREFVTKFSFI